MPTLNAASLTGVLSDGEDTDIVSAEIAENILDAAANRITACGYTIGVLTGTAGSKSRSVTQKELGWIQAVAVAIYSQEYKSSGSGSSSESTGLGPASASSSYSSGAGSPGKYAGANQLAQTAADSLCESIWSRAII